MPSDLFFKIEHHGLLVAAGDPRPGPGGGRRDGDGGGGGRRGRVRLGRIRRYVCMNNNMLGLTASLLAWFELVVIVLLTHDEAQPAPVQGTCLQLTPLNISHIFYYTIALAVKN